MDTGLPKVLIFGGEVRYGLEKFLKRKELNVVLALGEDEIDTTVDYVIDLVGEPLKWINLLQTGVRVVIVTDDLNLARDYEKVLSESLGEWRILVVENLYGDFFPEKVGWLSRLLTETVLNVNLDLPKEEVSLLYEEDMFEVASRLLFFSGGENGVYGLVGKNISVDKLEKALREAGRMTTKEKTETEVAKEIGRELWEKTVKLTRFEPRVGFEEVAEVALRPYFSRIDSLKRQKEEKVILKPTERMVVEEATEEEVVVKKEPPGEVKKDMVEEIKPEEEVKWEPQEEDEKFEMPEFSIKNSKITVDPKLSSWQEFFQKEDLDLKSQEPLEVETEKEKVKKTRKFSFDRFDGKLFKKILVVLFGGLLMFLIWKVVVVVKGGIVLRDNFINLEKRLVAGKWEEAEKSNQKSLAFLEGEKENLFLELVPESKRLVLLATEAIRLEQVMIPLLKQLQSMGGGIFGEKEVEWKDNIMSLMVNLADVEAASSSLYARMSGDLGWAPKSLFPMLVAYKQKLSDFREKLVVAHSAVPVLPDLLGLDGKRREYLVLLQNEMELRATGGFVGSYGVLSLEDGKLMNFEIRDVYATDGQLKGYVEPPPAIKEYLGEASWHMRDANYSPNFVQAAKDIRWFYEKSTGDRVDGVIGINLAVVFRILEETGPIYVPDFQVKVSKDTLFEQAESYSENNFFPGSKQKQSFLGALSKQLFEELRLANSTVAGKVAGAMLSSLEARDMQVAVNNSNTAKRLSALNWSGELYEGQCGKDCVADYFFPVESNFGVNKANYFIRRKVEGKSWWENGFLRRKVTITWENTAKNANWPAGDYKNYTRIYLPETIDVEKVVLTDAEAGGSKKEYQKDEYLVKKFGSRKELSLFLVVPVGKKRSLEINYNSQEGGNPGSNFTYLQYLQRQSGLGDKTSLSWSLAIPSEYWISQTEPEGKLRDKLVEFGGSWERDYKFGVEISK